MKKSIVALLICTLLFISFVAGFYVGRNTNTGTVQISGVPKYTYPATTAHTQPTDSTARPTLDALTLQIMAAINAATLEQLDEIPNIGIKTAQAILDYRQEFGDFQQPEDLLAVSGIGEKTLKNILDPFRGRITNEESGS